MVGDAVGRLGAPIYPMAKIDEKLADYVTPDGQTLSGTMMGKPEDNGLSSFEWAGEWTVTYETFRDMGAAFAVALVLIYMLVVGMFGNFLVPAIIMAPIPLTLLGIVPGHWLVGRAQRQQCLLHRHLDDRLHRAGRYHRAQLDPAGRLRGGRGAQGHRGARGRAYVRARHARARS